MRLPRRRRAPKLQEIAVQLFNTMGFVRRLAGSRVEIEDKNRQENG